MTALDTLTENGLSLGIELPLDNDLARRDVSGQGLFPDLTRHQERAQLADRLGFRALWLRDVPMWRPRDFGDAGQVFDPIPYLGYLAASTEHILLAIVAAAIVIVGFFEVFREMNFMKEILPAGTDPVQFRMLAVGIAMVLIANLSLMSKAEVERIWLPFVPWLLVGTALLSPAWRRWGLALQVVAALLVQHLFFTTW